MESSIYLLPSLDLTTGFVDGPALFIAPSRNSWNDFGARLAVEVRFQSWDKIYSGDIKTAKLLIKGQENSSDFIRKSIRTPTRLSSSGLAKKDFLLSLCTRAAYHHLIRVLGTEDARKILLDARDIGALYAFNPQDPGFQRLRMSKEFLTGLVREDEAYFSYIGLEALFQADGSPTFNGGRLKRIRGVVPVSEEFELPLDIDFVPDTLLEVSPIAAFIGPNGVGKTRTLIALADVIQRGEAELGWLNADYPNMVEPYIAEADGARLGASMTVFTYELNNWKTLSERGITVMSLGISPESWLTLTASLVSLLRKDAGRSRVGFNLSALDRAIGDSFALSNLVFPVLRGVEGDFDLTIGGQTYVRLGSLLRADEERFLNLIGIVDISSPIAFFDQRIGLYDLSSGQKSILLFASRILDMAEQGGLFLIDEPENHLHPKLISQLMLMLKTTLIARESAALVVTHSPFLVRELDRRQVYIFKRGELGNPVIYKPSLQTLGGNVSMIADNVFDDEDFKKVFENSIDQIMSESNAMPTESEIAELASSFGSDGVAYVLKNSRKARKDKDAK